MNKFNNIMVGFVTHTNTMCENHRLTDFEIPLEKRQVDKYLSIWPKCNLFRPLKSH